MALELEALGIDAEAAGFDLRTTGRAEAPLSFQVTRQLQAEDLARLAEPRGSEPSTIKKLRERHHALAKLLAQGTPPGEAGMICGYVGSRVSILLSDPAFKELVTFYRESVTERYFDMHEAAAALGRDAIEELHERLEDEPESFTIPALMELSKTMMDRVGHGPSSSQNINVNIGLAEKLQRARERTNAMRNITPPEEA